MTAGMWCGVSDAGFRGKWNYFFLIWDKLQKRVLTVLIMKLDITGILIHVGSELVCA